LKSGVQTETNYFGDFDKRYIVNPGDLLIGMDGEFGCYEWKGNPALLNQRVCRLQNYSSDLVPKFLFYGVSDYLKQIEEVTGFTTVKHLSSKQILEIQFPFPPLEQQRRIVGILDEAFMGIATAKANAEQNLRNSRAVFESVFMALAPKSEEEGCTKAKVVEIAQAKKGSIRTGPFGSQLLHSEFVDQGTAVLGIDNAVSNEFRWGKSRFITKEKYRQLERYRVYPGDVLITIMGTCGRCAIVPENIPVAINTKHLCCITLDQTKCLPGYLHAYFLYHPTAQEFLAARAKGSVMEGLNMGIIQELPVVLPSIKQQTQLVAAFTLLKKKTQRLESIYQGKIAALEALKKSLLHQAFSGKL
jgi:type I restriction enzyme S subunit